MLTRVPALFYAARVPTLPSTRSLSLSLFFLARGRIGAYFDANRTRIEDINVGATRNEITIIKRRSRRDAVALARRRREEDIATDRSRSRIPAGKSNELSRRT